MGAFLHQHDICIMMDIPKKTVACTRDALLMDSFCRVGIGSMELVVEQVPPVTPGMHHV